MAAPSLPTTRAQLRRHFKHLDWDSVHHHFYNDADEVDPFVVCDGVSVEVFNKYFADDELLSIKLRHVDLDDCGRVLIVEWPHSILSSTPRIFERMFGRAVGNDDPVGLRGAMTAEQPGLRTKAAHTTIGPCGGVENTLQPPTPRKFVDWVTLVVEVGRTQSWESLRRSAEWWCSYTGIQYVLLMKVSGKARLMEYELYDITSLGTLPLPTRGSLVDHRDDPQVEPVNVSFKIHRILAIPPQQPLPQGVNEHAVVNLRVVMDRVVQARGSQRAAE